MTAFQFALLILFFCSICTSLDLLDPPHSNSTRPFMVRLTKLLCNNQPYKNTEVHICSMKFRRSKPPCYNLHLTFTKPTESFHLHFVVYFKYNTYRQVLPPLDFDMCKYLAVEKGKGTNKLGDMIFRFLKKQFDSITRCPLYVPHWRGMQKSMYL